MEPREYEVMLHDAEIRLARVKALYEQFFQGIEKLEPTVPRKELDRLFEVLRKNQPRNTALRFRTQMLFAKYGTYQTYWQRTARQIEEGTYRRDLVRVAQRRQKEIAARERPRGERTDDDAGGAWELDVDVELEEPQSAQVAFDDSDVDAILGSLGPKTEPSPPPSRRSLSPFSSATSGSPLPAPRTTPLPTPGQTGEHPIAKPATTTFAKPVTTTFGKPGAAGSVATFGKPVAGSGGTATFGKPGKPSSDGGPIPQPSTAATPLRPSAPTPIAALTPIAAPTAQASPPRPPPPRPPPPRATAGASESAEEMRMRRLYDSYVEAKKKNNERVDNVKFETLAQSVQQMMPKLREKHGNRPIDFEIVVQNGKVGLKPKVGG